jgi:hypothetical protein
LRFSFHMSNFSKFLQPQEELLLVAEAQQKNYDVYLTMILLLFAFFILLPMWRLGRQGLALWLSLVLILIFVLAQQLTRGQNLYLLTRRRIIYLKASQPENYIFRGALYFKEINQISKQGWHNICLRTEKGKYYLFNLKQRSLVYEKISKLII